MISLNNCQHAARPEQSSQDMQGNGGISKVLQHETYEYMIELGGI
jgi:hypothetical protein